jgi:hypothetical protein
MRRQCDYPWIRNPSWHVLLLNQVIIKSGNLSVINEHNALYLLLVANALLVCVGLIKVLRLRESASK